MGMKYKCTFNLLILILLTTSCIHLVRHPNSGYSQENSQLESLPESANISVIDSDYNSNLNYKLMAELGITPNALNQPEIKKKYDLQLVIKNYERFLTSDREKKQYYSAIPWFKDESERMEFLKQPGYDARLLWMRNKGFGKRATQLDEETAELIEKKDISLGMSQDHVRKSWGPPDAIEIAGNPLYKNERWRYKRYTASSEGYKLQKRIIYFEGGKLMGWEQIDE